MSWLNAPSPQLRGKHYRRRPLAVWAVGVIVALVASLLSLVSLLAPTPAHAAIAHVQSTATTAWLTGTSGSKAFTSDNTAGNLIVVAVAWDAGGSFNCSDTRGNIYQVITTQHDLTNNTDFGICYANNIAAGSNTVTATFTGSMADIALIISEYSGLAKSNVVDVISTNIAVGTTATNNITSGSATTTSNGDLIYGAMIDITASTTANAGTGFTVRGSVSGHPMKSQDLTQATAGSVASTWTFTNAHRYISHMVAFRAAGASPPAPSRPTVLGDGLTVYSANPNGRGYTRTYSGASNSFSSAVSTNTGMNPRVATVRTSPNKREAVMGYVDDAGNFFIGCFDGTSWSHDWSANVGGTGTTKRYDIAYETNSGDVMVLYSTNTGTTNELAYRTKLGSTGCGASNWSSVTNLDPVRTSGTVQWVKMAWDRRIDQNLITAIWADSNSDLSAMQWSGSAWGNEHTSALETSLEVISTAQDIDDFDVEYESGGDVMVVWANSAGADTVNGVRYATCTGGTSSCAWSGTLTPATFANDATNLDISANPTSDEIVFASVSNSGTQGDLQAGYWSGSAWTNTNDLDTTGPISSYMDAGVRQVATGWLVAGSVSRSVIVYGDSPSTYVDWYVGNGGTFTLQTDFTPSPTVGDPQKYYDMQMDPVNKDRLMLGIVDLNNDYFSKRLAMDSSATITWTNADSSAALETNLAHYAPSPYSFAYWRNVSRPSLTQNGYIFENDDEDQASGDVFDENSQQVAGNTALTGVKKGERLNARLQVTNSGAPLESDLGLFYDRGDNIWSKVRTSTVPVTGAGTCADTTFSCTTIDSTNSTGGSASSVVDAAGTVWISYWDVTLGDLRLAHYVGSGGSGCASAAWTCVTIEATASVGTSTSMGIDPSGNTWISYYDIGNGDLRVARYVGSSGTGCAISSWTCTTVDSTNNVGQYTALAFDSSGNPWVGYYDTTNLDLRVARYVGSGGSGCASSAWTCVVVESANSVGDYISIAFDPTGSAWISYHDTTNTDLRVARYVGAGGTGCAVSTWTCTAVDSANSVGFFSSISFGPDGNAWISSRDSTNGDLRVARYVGSGGTGCATAAWTCTSVDTTNSVGQMTSIAFDPAGNPWVSYYDVTNADLRIARYVGSGGTGCAVTSWTCTAVDTTGDTGKDTSIVFDMGGKAWITYYDQTNSDLKIAQLNRQGEIVIVPSLAGSGGDSLQESHADMSSTGDTTNRDDADCSAAGAYFNNGLLAESENASSVALPGGIGTAQCTEVNFSIDTSQTTAGTTYRLILASKDALRSDRAPWRGISSVTNYATLMIETPTLTRVSKDNSYQMSSCADSAWTCGTIESTLTIDSSKSGLTFDQGGTAWAAFNTTAPAVYVAKYVGSGGSCSNTAWACTQIYSGGSSPDIQIAADGTPWVKFYKNSGWDLVVARYVGSGGTGCAVATWTCTTVATNAATGTTSGGPFKFDRSGAAVIPYFDGTAAELRVARYVGTGGSGCSSTAWTCTVIDTSAATQRLSDVAIDPTGNPWIVYDSGKVAKYVGIGGTGCSTPAWSCTTVLSSTTYQPGITFDGSGAAVAVFGESGSGNLTLAKYVGTGGTGCNVTSWNCEVLGNTNYTYSHSIGTDAKGVVWVAFWALTPDDLYVAKYVGSGGSNCLVSTWTCSAIDTTGNVGGYPLITFDKSGSPWIGYMDTTNTDTKVAKLILPSTQPSYAAAMNWSGRSGTTSDARYRLDSIGDTAVSTANSTFDTISATSSEIPLYVAAKQAFSTAAFPSMTWVGQSTVAFTTRAVTVQVWNNTTQTWVTPGSVTNGCSATGANTNCTISATATGTSSDYYESDGSNYWAYFRVYQAVGSTETLKTDLFSIVTNSTGSRALLTQRGGIWENDDGTSGVDTNTQRAAGNTAITNVGKGERATVRMQVDNSAIANSANLGLFYDRNDGMWSQVGAPNTPATGNGSGCATTAWDCTSVDTTNNVGFYSATATDSQGVTWIAYQDTTNLDLRVARYVGSGGSGCSNAAWSCVAVDSTNDVGHMISLALDTTGTPWISYYDNTNLDLRVARFVGSGGTGCAISSWTCTAVDTANWTGYQAAMAIDSSGAPWISYYEVSPGADLRVARYVGSGGTGCASSAWTCVSVDTTNDTGYVSSIAFDANGNPWVSFLDFTNYDLRVARYVGSGGSGCASSAWTCFNVDSTGSVGNYTSIAFDPAGNPWISTWDVTNLDMRVARYVGSGGTGCALSSWTCESVDTSGDTGYGTGLAFDPSGRAWVSYADNTTKDIHVARYVGSGGTGCAVATWTCTSVQTTNDIGQMTSIAFDQNGLPSVSYYDSTSGDLKVAKLRRSGELFMAAGLAGDNGAALSESHVDMTTTGDATNRDDADCSAGTGYVWNNGKWFETAEGTSVSLPSGNFSPQCTEVSFVLDTSQATAGTTYRFVVASKDGWRLDRAMWRGPVSVSNYPTLTIESSTTQRYAKDTVMYMPDCADTAWGCAVIEGTRNVGSFEIPIVFDSGGVPWAIFRDETNQDLVVARYVGSGGTGCDSTAWNCVSVETSGNTGSHGAMAIDASGNPWVSYFQEDTLDLKVAHYVGTGGTGCAVTTWTCEVVDSSGSTGYYSSIAIKGTSIWVGYRTGTGANVKAARYVGSGGTGCDVTTWSCVTVESTNDIGNFTSTAIDNAGNPWMTYYDVTNLDLRLARYVGSGGTGCAIASWTCVAVDSTNDVGNIGSSIGFDGSGNAWISYRDTTNGDLRVATYVGSGGTGCAIATFTCVAVDTTNDVGRDTSIAFDAAGKAWVSYRDVTNTDLRVARYVGSGGTGCAVTTWTCITVDSTNDVGSLSTISFDNSGTPWIGYKSNTNADWKIANLHLPPVAPSYVSRYTNPGTNATDGDARYRLDSAGKVALTADDTTYDTMTAGANETPMYTFAVRSASNSSFPDYDWMGQSSVAPSSKNVTIDIYRFGSTNAWTYLNTNSTAGASTQFTLRGAPSSGSASEYWEADGGNYWTYYRVTQWSNSSSETLTSDYFGVHVNNAPNVPTSLTQKTAGNVVLSTGQWHNSTSVKFDASVTDTDNPDTVQLCVEVKALGVSFTNTEDSCGTGAAYSGSSVTAAITRTLTDATEYHWQARTKDAGGLYSSWVSYDVNAESARDAGIDTTSPTGGTVYDGAAAGVDAGYNDGSLTQLSANWSGINSNASGLSAYEYSIGTSPGGTTIKAWTSNGTSTSVTASGLTLQTSQIYYFNVRTTDNAGNTAVISSDGQEVAPTLTFTLSDSSILFADLNAGNSYTDSKTLTATVTTNAYNGYQVTQYATGLMTSGSQNIAMYSGPWSNPTTWSGTGLGYTSSDSSVSGSNRFVGATEYAGVKNGGPGDVVADSSTVAVSGDSYTLTYRLTSTSSQAAGTYTNSLIISATALF